MGLVGVKSRCWQGCIPSGNCRDASVSLSLTASRSFHVPWLTAPSSASKANNARSRPSHTVSLSLPPSLAHRTPMILWAHLDSPGKSGIPRSTDEYPQCPPSHNLTYAHVPDVDIFGAESFILPITCIFSNSPNPHSSLLAAILTILHRRLWLDYPSHMSSSQRSRVLQTSSSSHVPNHCLALVLRK